MCNQKEHFCGVLHCNKFTTKLLLTYSSLGTYAISIEFIAFTHVFDSIWLLFEFLSDFNVRFVKYLLLQAYINYENYRSR